MTTRYIVVGDHPDTLASGQPVAPGDELPASAIDLKDPNDQHLLAEGHLIDLKSAREGEEETA